MASHQSRSSIELRALSSVCCPSWVRKTILIVRIILRRCLNFMHSTRARGGLEYCGSQIPICTHQARLLVETRSAART
eukprot:4682046-Pyramimonas_sp.AAC.1